MFLTISIVFDIFWGNCSVSSPGCGPEYHQLRENNSLHHMWLYGITGDIKSSACNFGGK